MRNLKRALSLALALVMVLSMMVVGAGAVSVDDFTDADEIVNTEAVTTMVSLGVIDGNDDGSYNPTGVVKRGEMAKLIAVMLNGGKDPTLGETPVVFADTAGHWAQNYISYVANLHIIDGRGDGTFGPNDDVTGSEAAKMILTALGYRSDLEGFTGANWAINVQSVANQIDLFDGLAINPDEGLSRDDTAQMLYNAVQSDMVEYRNLEGSYDGIVYPQPINGVDHNSTVLWERFQVRKVEGVVQATSLLSLEDSGTTVAGKARLTDIEYNGEPWEDTDGDPIPVTYPVEIDTALLGQRVVIYVKGLSDLAPNAANMEVIGTVIPSDQNTVVTTSGRLKDPDAVKDALRGEGLSMPSGDAKGVQVTAQDTTWNAVNGEQKYPGVEQTFIDNNADGRVDVVIQKTPGLALVNTYNESTEKMNLSGLGSIDFDDIQNPEDVAVDDHVLVYNYEGTYVLAVAESVTGTVTSFNNNSSTPHMSSVTVEDTDYTAGYGELLAPDLDKMEYDFMQEMVDGSYTLYLDPHGYVLGYVEDDAAAGNYAVITGVNATGHTDGFFAVEVKLIMADGSTGKYDVNLAASGKKWDDSTDLASSSAREEAMYNALTDDRSGGVYDGNLGANAAVDTLVTYSLDGNTVTLGLADYATNNYNDATASDPLSLTNTVSRYDFDGEILTADDKTVFFIKDKEDNYTAVQGLTNLRAKELETVGTSQAIYYERTGTSALEARAIFATVDEEYTSNSNYAFVTGNYRKTTSGTETIYTYPVVFENGEVGTLSAKDDAGVGSDEVHEYQLDGDYVNFDVNDSLVVNGLIVTGVYNNSVAFANAKNPAQDRVSYPTRGAQVWNVEEPDDGVFGTDLRKNDLVALVLDNEGIVVTAFVYDRQDDDMVDDYSTAPTVSGSGKLDLAKGEWTNASSGDTLGMTLSGMPADVTATLQVTETGTGSTIYGGDGQTVGNGTLTLYTAGADENGGTITVTLTLEDDNDELVDRVITYVIKVSAAHVEAPAIVVEGNGTEIDANADGSYTWNGARAGEEFELTVTSAGTINVTRAELMSGSTLTESLDGSVAGASVVSPKPLTSGSATTIYTLDATNGDSGKSGTIELDLVVDDGTNLPYTTTIKININCETLFAIKNGTTNATAYYAEGETVSGDDITNTAGPGRHYVIDGKVYTSDGSGKIVDFVMPAHDVPALASTDQVYAVAPVDVTTHDNGLLADVRIVSTSSSYKDDEGNFYVKAGDTVTIEVTMKGTATATETIKPDGLGGGTVKRITLGTLTNAQVNGTTGVTIISPNTVTEGTFTFTYEAAGANSAPTVKVEP